MLSFLRRIRNSNQFLFDYQQGSNPTKTHLRFIHKPISKPQEEEGEEKLEEPIKNPPSFTESHLINSCRLSPSSALSAAQKIQLKTTHNAASVLSFLKSRGFTSTQIAELVTKNPKLLRSSVEDTLKPKADFFVDVGFSDAEFASLACSHSKLFWTSLRNRLKPNFELLSSMIGDNKKLLVAFRRSARLLSQNLDTRFLPNVRLLQSYGVPSPNIAKLAANYPRVLTNATKEFAKTVDSIKNFGFDPLLNLFVRGVYVMSGMSAMAWEKKFGIYKSLGFSEGEIISAFTKQPSYMRLSENKIRKMINFYVKRLHLEPNYLAARPLLLCYSFEKRVLPRCSALSILSSKRLIRGYPYVIYTVVSLTDDKFFDKYVRKYMDQVPEVLEAYKGNLEVVEFEGGSVQGS